MTTKRTLLSLSGALALSLSGCATDRQVISQARSTNAELAPAIIDDPRLTEYMQAIGTRIVAAARAADADQQGPQSHFSSEDNAWMFESGRFHLVGSETLNAFTTGGEYMYIYSEVLEQCRSEDELAAVMAHEYAHVYSRHVHKGMNRQVLAASLAAGASLAGLAIGGEEHGQDYAALAGLSTATATNFLGLGYTRADEAEADEWGFHFYSRAGWDPQRFGDFFQQLIDQGHDTSSATMSDHPTLASRVERARELAAALPPEAGAWRRAPIADAPAFAAIQRRTADVARKLPSSEQAVLARILLTAVPSCLLPSDAPEQKAAQHRLAVAAQSASARPGSD